MRGRPVVPVTIRVAVITGRHGYEVAPFHQLFRAIPDTDCYIQHLEDWGYTPREEREAYDAVVFYNMHIDTPPEETPWWESQQRASFEQLGETSQGIVVLHHAILAYPQWQLWTDITGLADRSFGFFEGETVTYNIANPDHPITRGLSGWTMVDETYTMQEPGDGSEVLIITDHPNSMKTIAWTRQHRSSRVFCFQCGHDSLAFADPNFREVLGRGIRWSVGRD